MRYIIDTDTKSLIEDFIEGRTDVEIVDKYEPIEKLTARIEKMRLAFEEFKKNRGSFKVLNYYLRGRGLAQREIDNVFRKLEDFFDLVK